MNPAALKAEPRRARAGVHAARELGRLRRAQPEEGGLRDQPPRRRLARGLPRDRGAHDRDHPGSVQAARGEAARRRALEELLRARADLVDVHAAGRADARVDRPAVPSSDRRCATPTWPRSRRACTSARPPSCSSTRTRSSRRDCEPGEYRNITGNIATAYGLIAAAQLAKLPILYASYPITPASDILHELSKHKHFGVRTVQAEDEIAAAGGAIGARVRRAPRHHHHERTRCRPQDRKRSVSRSASSCRW